LESEYCCQQHLGVQLAEGSTNEKSCRLRLETRRYTAKEKARITAGAVASLVIVGWIVVLAVGFLSAR
jgi:hypothetical protein